MIQCPQCHQENPPQAKFCLACGVRLTLACSACSTELPAGARFCLACGQPVQAPDTVQSHPTAPGDTTNLAARLQQLAEPGTILLSETTARLVQSAVRLEALEPVQVKGKTDPVVALRVLGLRPRRSPLAGLEERTLSPFVGRERELTTLHELLAQVEAGQGQVVGLVGEAGVGKSRLLFEFRQRLRERRVTYLEGRCLSYGSALPYLPLMDILRNNAGITESDGPEAMAAKVRLSLQEVGLDPAEGLSVL